ncbi:transmembrane protease serine 5 isoform X9 [Neofelis nebulosa]|uniref:transmembrane protease serine 5 isoform X9 n=1 Tax=Neofelis nebulosa TaxID=61452 RepID=UPI00272B0ABB|nr:transmembrane protease serine 5 isoform X9 [Neofelis nebulosa]
MDAIQGIDDDVTSQPARNWGSSLMPDGQAHMEPRYAEEGPGPGIFRAEPGDPLRRPEAQQQPTSRAGRWCSRRCGCVGLGALALLAGASVGSWLLVLYLWPAASQPSPGNLQNEEMPLSCSEASGEEALLPSLPRTVSFRINPEGFLLAVQVRARPDWLLVCHEGWSSALGLRICQSLGHLSFRLSRLSSWRVYTGLVSHSAVRPHQGAVVERIIPHPLYSTQNHDYDVALLQLRTPLNFSDTVGAVCLPAEKQDFPRGSQCWVSGWGHTDPSHTHNSDTLQDTVVSLLGTRLCNSSCMYSGALTPRMLCAGYVDGRADACQGDSGGPLVCLDGGTWHLVGVVSWGRGCAEPNHPGVYAKVAEFLDWIHDTVRARQMEEELQTQVQKARTSFRTRQSSPAGQPPGPGLSSRALVLSPSFSPGSLSNRRADGAGLEKWGEGRVRKMLLAAAGPPPSPPLPFPARIFWEDARGCPGTAFSMSLRQGKCLLRGAPGPEASGQMGSRLGKPMQSGSSPLCMFSSGCG